MKYQVYEGEPIRDTFYYLSGTLQIIFIVLTFVAAYFLARIIYRFIKRILENQKSTKYRSDE